MTDQPDGFAPDDMTFAVPADVRVDCNTCLAANTTACNECVVTHLLANDDGPIQFVTVSRPERVSDPIASAVGLLAGAGLLDDSPVWVDRDVFERGETPRANLSLVR